MSTNKSLGISEASFDLLVKILDRMSEDIRGMNDKHDALQEELGEVKMLVAGKYLTRDLS